MDNDLHLEIRKKIGERIRKVREDKQLPLRELEAITGIGHSWLGKLENGKVNFQIDSLLNLLSVLKIQPKELFNFKVDYREEE